MNRAEPINQPILSHGSVSPLVSEPDVDWKHLSAPNIIAGYWQNSFFFRSEEHAREQRLNGYHVPGVYLTLEQKAYSTRIAQSALFGFVLSF